MDWKNINKETIISTALLVLSLVNQVLTMIGCSPLPIEDELVTNVISVVFLLATTAWSWWHNNSVTSAAQIGDQIMDALKSGKISEGNVQALIDYINAPGAVTVTTEPEDNNGEEG